MCALGAASAGNRAIYPFHWPVGGSEADPPEYFARCGVEEKTLPSGADDPAIAFRYAIGVGQAAASDPDRHARAAASPIRTTRGARHILVPHRAEQPRYRATRSARAALAELRKEE